MVSEANVQNRLFLFSKDYAKDRIFVTSWAASINIMAKIYVASSWRNKYYPEVVEALRKAGHQVYDFRNPPHGGNGFHWTDIDENAPNWTFEQYAEGLHHELERMEEKALKEGKEVFSQRNLLYRGSEKRPYAIEFISKIDGKETRVVVENI